MHYYGFRQCYHTPTHRKGGLLDNIYLNFSSAEILIDVITTFYSDHFLLSIAVPYIHIQ